MLPSSDTTVTTPPAPTRRLYGVFVTIALLSAGLGVLTERYYLALLPFLTWVVAQVFMDFRPLFYLLLLTIPLSTDIALPGGFKTDLPTEPLAIGLTGVLLLHLLIHWRQYEARRFFHPLAVLLYLHVGWILLATVFSDGVVVSLKFSAAKLWYVGAYFLMPLLLLRRLGQVGLAIKCIFWALLFVALQTLVRHGLAGFSFADQYGTMYPFMPEHVSYAACLSVFTPWLIFLRWWRKHSGRSTAWFDWVILPIWFAAVFFTYTRAAFVALFLAAAVYYLVKWKLLKPALFAAVLLALAAVTYFVRGNRYLDYAPNFDTTISHDEFGNLISATYKFEDISTMERLYRWVAAGQMIPYRPWTGWGPGNFLSHYKGFTVNSFRTYVSDNEDQSGIHSYYLMTLVEQGFPGLFIFLLYVFGALVIGARMYHRQRDPVARQAIMAALLALVVVDAFNLINDQMETDKVGAQYLLNLAILISMGLYHPGEREPRRLLE